MVFVTEQGLDRWLASRIGPGQLAQISAESRAETLADRELRVSEIREIEARRDAALADLQPKLKPATARVNKVAAEHLAATNVLNCLRRKVAFISDSAARAIGKVENVLRGTAAPEIDAFIREIHKMRGAVRTLFVGEEVRGGEIFSSRAALEQRIVAINAARAAAEGLKIAAVGDVAAAISAIRATIPTGALEMTDTGVKTKASMW